MRWRCLFWVGIGVLLGWFWARFREKRRWERALKMPEVEQARKILDRYREAWLQEAGR